MNRTKALVVVCSLLVLLGGSMSLALADSPWNAANPSEQDTVPSERTQSVTVEILPEADSILRDQSATFVVRVVSDGEEGILLGLRLDAETPASFEFGNPNVQILAQSWLYPQFDVVGYLPADAVEPDESIPVTVSPEETFAVGTSSVEVTRISRVPEQMVSEEFQLDVRCPVGCRVTLLLNWFTEDPERIVAVLGLLIAFFGRKKIWAALRTPRTRLAGTGGNGRERRSERDRERE